MSFSDDRQRADYLERTLAQQMNSSQERSVAIVTETFGTLFPAGREHAMQKLVDVLEERVLYLQKRQSLFSRHGSAIPKTVKPHFLLAVGQGEARSEKTH